MAAENDAWMAERRPGRHKKDSDPRTWVYPWVRLTPLQHRTVLALPDLPAPVRQALARPPHTLDVYSMELDVVELLLTVVRAASPSRPTAEKRSLNLVAKYASEVLDVFASFDAPEAPAPENADGEPSGERGPWYRFKITLTDSKPLVWRRIVMPEGTLHHLHDAICGAMKWDGFHLHAFKFGSRRAGFLGMDELSPRERFEYGDFEDDMQVRLKDVFRPDRPVPKLKYVYDFGDHWLHAVHFEGFETDPARQLPHPLCIAAVGEAPDEDIGGVWAMKAPAGEKLTGPAAAAEKARLLAYHNERLRKL